MKWIKKFKKFQESIEIDVSLIKIDLNESLSVSIDDLMKFISAEEIDLDSIELLKDSSELTDEEKLFKAIKEVSKNIKIEEFTQNATIIDSISNLKRKLSSVQNTVDSETYIKNPFSFLLIYENDKIELVEDPDYMITQDENDKIKVYRVGKGFNQKFYNFISMKTIKIKQDDAEWTYFSSNKNEWELKSGKSSDIFKKILRKNELEDLINNNRVKLEII